MNSKWIFKDSFDLYLYPIPKPFEYHHIRFFNGKIIGVENDLNFQGRFHFERWKCRVIPESLNENPLKVIINRKWVTDNTVKTVKTKTMTEYSSLVVIRSSKNEKIGQDQLVAFTRADKYDDFQIWRYKNSKWQNFG